MSYEISGRHGSYWSCHQEDWQDYLDLAVEFGWEPAGVFFKCDERGYRPHPTGSYLGNDFQTVTEEDAVAFSAALNRALAAGKPLTVDLEGVRGLEDLAANGEFMIH